MHPRHNLYDAMNGGATGGSMSGGLSALGQALPAGPASGQSTVDWVASINRQATEKRAANPLPPFDLNAVLNSPNTSQNVAPYAPPQMYRGHHAQRPDLPPPGTFSGAPAGMDFSKLRPRGPGGQ